MLKSLGRGYSFAALWVDGVAEEVRVMSGPSIMIWVAMAVTVLVVLLTLPAAREARSRKNAHQRPPQ